MDTSRLSKLRKLLKENNIDAALISSLANIIHLTNFSYFTDLEREAFLLITKTKQYILTDSRYSHAVRTHIKKFELLELHADKPLTEHLKNVINEENIKILGIEENNLTVAEHKRIQTIIKKTKHVELQSLRIIKEKEEITKIKKACAIGDKAFTYLLKQIKIGMTEKEVAFLLETFIRKQHGEPSFPSIVAFGANAAVPHHKTGDTKLKKNDLILLDFGVKYENYCSDMTRTIFFGKATKEQKKVYQIVKTAQQKAIEYIQKYCHAELDSASHKTVKKIPKHHEGALQVRDDKLFTLNIDQTARQYIIAQGYPSIPHSLGHGIGLQVHEAPSISPKAKYELTEGMVFSIEPGIYLNDKFGVRIEDLFAIKNSKLVRLTKSPRELIEL